MYCFLEMITCVFVSIAMSGCASSALPEVDDRLVRLSSDSQVSQQQLRHGRQLMLGQCAYCHTPVYPTSISMERWNEALPRMIKRARLPKADEADIRAYVQAVRAMESQIAQ